MIHEELTNKIICAFYNVYNNLGHGFLEKVYENSLAIELGKFGLTVAQQERVQVFYEGIPVGDYIADMTVEEAVVLELKSAELLKSEHVSQLRNYLKATDKEVGLLLNFGRTPEFKRIVLGNEPGASLTDNGSRSNQGGRA